MHLQRVIVSVGGLNRQFVGISDKLDQTLAPNHKKGDYRGRNQGIQERRRKDESEKK